MSNNQTIPIAASSFLMMLAICFLAATPARSQRLTIRTENSRPAGAPFFIEPAKPLPKGEMVLENMGTGAVLPLQVSNSGLYAAVLEAPLGAGEQRRYLLRKRKRKDGPETEARAEETDSFLNMMAGQKLALRYALAEQLPAGLPGHYRRSGFIHPAFSPGGMVLTDGFPAGHAHQHGIFLAWVNTLFRAEKVDFWNQQQETGTVVHLALDTLFSGPVFAEAVVRLQHQALAFGPVLEERWIIRLYNHGNPFIWEIESSQQNLTEDTLHILEYHYGGLGIRGSGHWNPADSLNFLEAAEVATRAGETRLAANHTRPGWVAIYGNASSGLAGLAVMDHPGNFRFPQHVRVHPDMPYFCFAPMVGGAFDLPPGQPFGARYRFIAFDGQPDVESLDGFFRDFGNPMIVRN